MARYYGMYTDVPCDGITGFILKACMGIGIVCFAIMCLIFLSFFIIIMIGVFSI